MKRIIMCFTVLLSLISVSCITNKDVVYLQDKGTVVDDALVVKELTKPYRLQINDILSINIKAIDSELKKLVEVFKPVENVSGTLGQESLYFNGYTVDLHGNIEFPILGEINVLGFTTDEVTEKVKEQLHEKYLQDVSQDLISTNYRDY